MRSLIPVTLAVALCSMSLHADSQRPSTVDGVSATRIENSAIRVTWNQAWDDNAVEGYNVYRDGSYYATVPSTNFIDQGTSAGTTYRYHIVAFDRARNFAEASAEATVSDAGPVGAAPPSGGAPGKPSNLQVEYQPDNQIRLLWERPSGNIDGFDIYRDGAYLTTTKSTEFPDSGLSQDQEYRYQVIAFSTDRRYSDRSDELVVRGGGNRSNASEVGSQLRNAGGDSGYVPGGYRMVFNDEFQGSDVDYSKWNTRYRWGPDSVINYEKQYYVDWQNDKGKGSPFEFDGEHMSIFLKRTPDWLQGSVNGQPYMSGALTTYNKFRMQYGYVEMRARMPRGKGLWHSFWLLHQNENGIRPEIDVVELIGDNTNVVYNTYHHFENNQTLKSTPSYSTSGPDYAADFHTYGMKWEPGKLTWYVDGVETASHSGGDTPWEDMYLLVNLAAGGWWAGDPDNSTPLPASLTIDYIRAYSPN